MANYNCATTWRLPHSCAALVVPPWCTVRQSISNNSNQVPTKRRIANHNRNRTAEIRRYHKMHARPLGAASPPPGVKHRDLLGGKTNGRAWAVLPSCRSWRGIKQQPWRTWYELKVKGVPKPPKCSSPLRPPKFSSPQAKLTKFCQIQPTQIRKIKRNGMNGTHVGTASKQHSDKRDSSTTSHITRNDGHEYYTPLSAGVPHDCAAAQLKHVPHGGPQRPVAAAKRWAVPPRLSAIRYRRNAESANRKSQSHGRNSTVPRCTHVL